MHWSPSGFGTYVAASGTSAKQPPSAAPSPASPLVVDASWSASASAAASALATPPSGTLLSVPPPSLAAPASRDASRFPEGWLLSDAQATEASAQERVMMNVDEHRSP